MSLDSKISSDAVIGTLFNAERLKSFIGCECYFADEIFVFTDLKYYKNFIIKGILKDIQKGNKPFLATDIQWTFKIPDGFYTVCIPCSFVKEKI